MNRGSRRTDTGEHGTISVVSAPSRRRPLGHPLRSGLLLRAGVGLVAAGVLVAAPAMAWGQEATTLPPVTVPPPTAPATTLPPVTLPPETLPPTTLPPPTLPPETLAPAPPPTEAPLPPPTFDPAPPAFAPPPPPLPVFEPLPDPGFQPEPFTEPLPTEVTDAEDLPDIEVTDTDFPDPQETLVISPGGTGADAGGDGTEVRDEPTAGSSDGRGLFNRVRLAVAGLVALASLLAVLAFMYWRHTRPGEGSRSAFHDDSGGIGDHDPLGVTEETDLREGAGRRLAVAPPVSGGQDPATDEVSAQH